MATADAGAAAPFPSGGESLRKQVSPSRRSLNTSQLNSDRNETTGIQITNVPMSNQTGTSENDQGGDRIILQGVAWKRRSGFGRLSDTVGVGKSWERRKFVLYSGDNNNEHPRLVYYPLNSFQSQTTPRGTLDLLSERATAHATHFGNEGMVGQQPTPYTLSIRTTFGIAPEETKWKLCFDDRYSQMVWLVALTDVVVEASVRSCNAATLAAEVDPRAGLLGLGGMGGGDHGGFHRLYEEGVPEGGMLGLVKDGLLEAGRSDTDGNDGEQQQQQQTQEQTDRSTNTPLDEDGGNEGSVSGERRYAPMESFVDMEEAAATSTEQKGNVGPRKANDSTKDDSATGPLLAFDTQSLLQALAVVNVSVLYAHFTAKSTSFLVISWWQVLLAVNVCLYKCLEPTKQRKNRTSDTKRHENKELYMNPKDETNQAAVQENDEIASIEKNDTDMSLEMTKSMIGAELLRGEDVPLSDEPTAAEPSLLDAEASAPGQTAAEASHGRETLTEDEMEAHDHERWAVAAPNVDLSGSWTLIADDAFKAEYDQYLFDLGFNRITRGVACSLISRTLEETKQTEGGRKLYLKGTNPKGCWERTLISSGYPDFHTHSTKKEGLDYQHSKSFIKTADAEDVSAEAWWEDRGTVHRSWLRGGTKYGGGDFESLRYLGTDEGADGDRILVCKSIFHPKDVTKKDAIVTWRFKRNETETS